MKSFLAILIGCVLGGIVYVSATYNLYPIDTGGYISYSGTTLISAVISAVVALIFFGFFHFFKVKSESLVVLATTAFLTQLAVYLTPLLFSANVNGLVFIIAVPLFPALANFLLDTKERGHKGTQQGNGEGTWTGTIKNPKS